MAERSTVEVLKAARERITPEERWTRGAFARTEDGMEASPMGFDATCWCAEGAIQAEAPDGRDASVAESALRCVISGASQSILWLNDGPNSSAISGESHPRKAPARHKRVLAAFDKAIQLAEEASSPPPRADRGGQP